MPHRPSVVVAASLCLASLASACSVHQQHEYPRKVALTEKQYAARDACLKRNIAPLVNTGEDVTRVARVVSAACEPETAKLIGISAPAGGVDVAEAIRKDTEFRAAGFLLRARGAPSEN